MLTAQKIALRILVSTLLLSATVLCGVQVDPASDWNKIISVEGARTRSLKLTINNATVLSNAFNTRPGDPDWDPQADLNGDGVVDILDAIILARAVNVSSLQYVSGDRIFDENGKEVIWRGAGGSYLFHTDDYIAAWNLHLPEIQQMGLNTMRLAFRFPDSNPGQDGYVAADTMDFSKLDQVLTWLDEHNLKAILDCHNCGDMNGDFGSQKLVNDWRCLAGHYCNDSRIVAYELFNEPESQRWDSSIQTKEDVAKAYQTLTKEVRTVDREHIVIWQSQPYLPVLGTVSQYFEPNTVFTMHRWCSSDDVRFQIWSVENFSFANSAYLVAMRQKLNVPFWLGEFGSYDPFTESNPEWLLAEQTLSRCEEQSIGWNLWMGRVSKNDLWIEYLKFFPLKAYNQNLARRTWDLPMPNLLSNVIAQQGADMFEPCQIQLWHSGDCVTFKQANMTIIVIIEQKMSDGTIVIESQEQIAVTEGLKIQNDEGSVAHPGDWNTIVLSC